MAIIQLNPTGMLPIEEGYITSVTVRSNGKEETLVPDPLTGQVACSPQAALRLIGGSQAAAGGPGGRGIKLIQG
jgi:hypothetical protein